MSHVLRATCYKVGFAREIEDLGAEGRMSHVLHATKWEKAEILKAES
jgi:hypothetical protein